MTDETLNAYYKWHKDMYMSLAKCSCVQEVLLKLEIYGKRWTHYDWAFLLIETIHESAKCIQQNNDEDIHYLYDDVIDTINNTKLLNDVITNKDIILNLVNLTNAILNNNVENKIYALLAHIFKKFPDMWNMSWMFTKRRWRKTVLRQHKLRNAVHRISTKMDADKYYFSKQYYDDFMTLYLK